MGHRLCCAWNLYLSSRVGGIMAPFDPGIKLIEMED